MKELVPTAGLNLFELLLCAVETGSLSGVTVMRMSIRRSNNSFSQISRWYAPMVDNDVNYRDGTNFDFSSCALQAIRVASFFNEPETLIRNVSTSMLLTQTLISTRSYAVGHICGRGAQTQSLLVRGGVKRRRQKYIRTKGSRRRSKSRYDTEIMLDPNSA
jgi:hypothetical protein